MLAQYQTIQSNLSQTQQQISSGKVGTQYADVKDQSGVLAAAKSKAASIASYSASVKDVVNRLDLYDTQLQGLSEVTAELRSAVVRRAQTLGMAVIDLGIKDIILPGEMKDLLRKVTEAKKAAEANLIVRREETAALRNQLNSARLIDSSPTLLRLRELEVLERVAANSKLKIWLGDAKLQQKIAGLV